MEIIQGKNTHLIGAPELARIWSAYRDILVDLGTGDGRFVLHAARQEPGIFAIGVDACRENLRDASRAAPANVLFAIADITGTGMPFLEGGRGIAARVTINFPWGSLRDALLAGEGSLLDNLNAMMRPGGRLELRLNASALAEAGWELQAGGDRVAQALARAGFRVSSPRLLAAPELRDLPSTWAKRLAFGRRPEAIYIRGQKIVPPVERQESAVLRESLVRSAR